MQESTSGRAAVRRREEVIVVKHASRWRGGAVDVRSIRRFSYRYYTAGKEPKAGQDPDKACNNAPGKKGWKAAVLRFARKTDPEENKDKNNMEKNRMGNVPLLKGKVTESAFVRICTRKGESGRVVLSSGVGKLDYTAALAQNISKTAREKNYSISPQQKWARLYNICDTEGMKADFEFNTDFGSPETRRNVAVDSKFPWTELASKYASIVALPPPSGNGGPRTLPAAWPKPP